MTPTSAFTDDQYARAFPPGIERHYWHQARNRLIWRKVRRLCGSGAVVLDIGCGPGITVEFLRGRRVDCRGVDTARPRPVHPGLAAHLSLATDAFALPAGFRERVTLLLLLDVLEHLDAPEEFLGRCVSSFPSATGILVTVPARAELWSNYDEFYGHRRRYTTRALAELASESLELVESGYFFHSLYVAGRLAALGKRRSIDVPPPTFPRLHRFAGWLMDVEDPGARPRRRRLLGLRPLRPQEADRLGPAARAPALTRQHHPLLSS